ncbi:hypothetical protein PTTG_27682 [Puccinia triticina 1-1 BBBD Race 1]|uniref:Uncharacterized protein n=1 Tax=Puccinia triticina (isolate 1-1 / race 1 (BBBD)) TaxID=630390 RepID=A0A180GIK3_PUCT1|nr:hypothetical protein PTTG_27682 [Puccinia triticina 1-1 BBBD Race 1]WAR62366.1 hypothetical protein PtB15_14B461 [Puccinia triticina]
MNREHSAGNWIHDHGMEEAYHMNGVGRFNSAEEAQQGIHHGSLKRKGDMSTLVEPDERYKAGPVKPIEGNPFSMQHKILDYLQETLQQLGYSPNFNEIPGAEYVNTLVQISDKVERDGHITPENLEIIEWIADEPKRRSSSGPEHATPGYPKDVQVALGLLIRNLGNMTGAKIIMDP